jgi:hypothetical protein
LCKSIRRKKEKMRIPTELEVIMTQSILNQITQFLVHSNA